MNFPNPKFHFP